MLTWCVKMHVILLIFSIGRRSCTCAGTECLSNKSFFLQIRTYACYIPVLRTMQMDTSIFWREREVCGMNQTDQCVFVRTYIAHESTSASLIHAAITQHTYHDPQQSTFSHFATSLVSRRCLCPFLWIRILGGCVVYVSTDTNGAFSPFFPSLLSSVI